MIKRFRSLLGDRRGVGTVEFALACPVLFFFLIGASQIGVLFYANAGLRNTVAEGARIATIYPTPSTTTIKARMAAKRFGLDQLLGRLAAR